MTTAVTTLCNRSVQLVSRVRLAGEEGPECTSADCQQKQRVVEHQVEQGAGQNQGAAADTVGESTDERRQNDHDSAERDGA
jgi:hypothetical protein